MQQWKVSSGKRNGGSFDTATIRRLVDTAKLSKSAFVRTEDETNDWQQISTVESFVDESDLGEPLYCMECDCRAIVSQENRGKSIRCPACFTIGPFVDFLDETAPDVLSAPPEPWGKYDVLVIAFSLVALMLALIGASTIVFNPSLSVLLGFILLVVGAGLFVVTFQHRSESSRYRSHLKHVETMLHLRTEVLASSNRELNALKRNLVKVRADLLATTEEECRQTRKEIEEQLYIARDQRNAIHRMAERFLSETRKWWTSKLTGQNYPLMKERISKAIEFCRKQGYPVTKAQEQDVFKQLKTDFEIVLTKEHEKAEQLRMREQLRDDQRAQRELQRELARTESETARREAEQRAIERALAEAMKLVGAEHSAEVEKLQESLREAQQRVLEAQEMTRRTKSQAELTRAGNVYVISNVGSFGENGYKVGLTRRLDPMDRVKELGDASVPFPFDVHMMIRSDDAPALERTLHKALHRYRINRVNFRKEFFRVDLDTIRQLVEKHHGKIEYEYEQNGEESEYEQSLRVSDADFASMASANDKLIFEDEDDDFDGADELSAVADDDRGGPDEP